MPKINYVENAVIDTNMINAFVQQEQVKNDWLNANNENVPSQLATLNALNDKADKNSIVIIDTTQTITGNKTFSGTTSFTGSITANGYNISPTELSYLDACNSNIQNQINAKAEKIKIIKNTQLNSGVSYYIPNISNYAYILFDLEFFTSSTTLIASLKAPYKYYSIAANTSDNDGIFCVNLFLDASSGETKITKIGYYNRSFNWQSRNTDNFIYCISQIRGILK